MITATVDQLARAEKFLGAIPGAAERALSRAMNAAIKSAAEEAVVKIRDRYNTAEKDVRSRLDLQSAKPSALTATLLARSPSLPLHYFTHAPTRPGTGGRGKPRLVVEVLRGEPKTMASAFIAKLGIKPRIVVRTGKKTASGKSELKVLFSVPIPEQLGVAPVRLAVEERAMEMLDEKLGVEIDRELGRAA